MTDDATAPDPVPAAAPAPPTLTPLHSDPDLAILGALRALRDDVGLQGATLDSIAEQQRLQGQLLAAQTQVLAQVAELLREAEPALARLRSGGALGATLGARLAGRVGGR